MIARYSRPRMARIWEDRSRLLNWLAVEMAVCEELGRMGRIPRRDWSRLKRGLDRVARSGGVNPARVSAIEKTTRHDLIAFTTALAERLGPSSRYVHFGLTSSDVVDTSLALQIGEAGREILDGVDALLGTLRKKALAFRALPTIGRSHGIHAEPTSFGLKFLGWYSEWARNRQRLATALEGLRYGKLSGAVGVNAHWSPAVEKRVLRRLGLRREPVATQVVPRDRHAAFLSTLALCGASIERLAIELRHLQRSEVGEVIEGFRPGQRGSSAMPHKRNPVSSENLTGCARLLRSYAQAGLENVALWHERDISHSSVERVALPDSTILLDYALGRAKEVLDGLHVRADRVELNLSRAGSTVYSGHFLMALVERGATREQAYRWVQDCAIRSLDGRGGFVELLQKHPEVAARLTQRKIQELGSLSYQLRNVGAVYREGFREAARRGR